MKHTNVIEALQERGFIDSMTSEEIKKSADKPLKVYCGFDPTSDSLHVGNLVAMMGLAWFQRFGHTPIAVVGGATGMIGDPSGKNAERNLLSPEDIKRHSIGIRKNLETILDFNHKSAPAMILDNFDWFKDYSFIDFLRDIGKYFRVGPMLAKDSVKTRLNSEEGISFTEFSYQVLQGYDFLYLYDHFQVTVQLGGSDQWGNITAGTDLIRKTRGQSVHGLTFPLLTRSDGQKFGKSEKGAIWLSPEKLSPYEFYQYFYRVSDADVIRLMQMLTFMEMSEINHYSHEMKSSSYQPNSAQKRLAQEVTQLVHGEVGLNAALRATEGIAPGSTTVLDVKTLEMIAQDMPNHSLSLNEVLNIKLIDLLSNIGMQTSKGEARRLIKNGGVSINNEKVTDENLSIDSSHLIEAKLMLIALGKKNKALIRIK